MESANLSQPDQPYHPKHHIKVYVWTALVAAAFLVAINGYLLRLSYLEQGARTAQETERRTEELRAERSNKDWTIYRNDKYEFEISYPDKDWRVEESTGNGGPILAGFYFGPIDSPVINIGTTTVRDMSNWGIVVFDKSRATADQINVHPGGIQYEKNGKIYVIFNEGSRLEPQSFETFIYSFRFIDDISDWQTYRNEEYGFEFKYPGDNAIREHKPTIEYIQVFTDSTTIKAMTYAYKDESSDWFLDSPPNGQITIGNIVWKTFFLSDGYCDGPGCSLSIYAIQTRNGDKLYSVQLGDKQEIGELQNQILSTFRFLE